MRWSRRIGGRNKSEKAAKQQLLLYLYDLQHVQSAAAGVQAPFFRALREAIGCGVVKPGRNFPLFLAATASGVETWAAFGAFLRQREQAAEQTG